MMMFGGLSMLAVLVYLVLVVLAAMFMFRGIVYFKQKAETDRALLQKVDQLIEVLDKGIHNPNGNE
jgi:hypothetical protein